MNRRSFMRVAGGSAVPALLAPGFAWADDAKSDAEVGRLLVRVKEPRNLEYDFPTLDSYLTPTKDFYVRNHFAQPAIDVRSWRLKVEGAVRKPLELTYDDIRGMASRSVFAVMECAGNGRSFLVPAVKGVPWGLGAVGNARWTGVPLAAILEKAGLEDRAVEVVLEGADSGMVAGAPTTFSRSLPLSKARKPEVLLAHAMNGEALTEAHGFPVRAVVPGWYGMASIKWLRRLNVVDQPYKGHFQTADYAITEPSASGPILTPLGEMQVKAQIAQPSAGAVLPAKQPCRITGAAWSGEGTIVAVEVSTDGGQRWREARLRPPLRPFAWLLWDCTWQPPAAGGEFRLLARAFDSKGNEQGRDHDPIRRNYMVSHSLPVRVTVQ